MNFKQKLSESEVKEHYTRVKATMSTGALQNQFLMQPTSAQRRVVKHNRNGRQFTTAPYQQECLSALCRDLFEMNN